MRMVIFLFVLSAALTGVRVIPGTWLLGAAFLFPGILVLIPLAWFLVLRWRILKRPSQELELSFQARKTISVSMIILGITGFPIWPFAWHAHFRHIMMGDHPSGHPMFTIYLGFLPFLFLLILGIAFYPYRRWKRGRYAKRPPDIA